MVIISKRFSWQDLLKQWDVKDFELLEYIKEGLQPYLKPGKEPIYCPYEYHLYKQKNDYFYEKISVPLIGLNKLDILEKAVEKAKPELCYAKSFFPLIIKDYLFKQHNISISRDDNKGYLITSEIIEILKTYRNELEEEKIKITKEIEDIVKGDPNLNESQKKLNWKYFIMPSSYEEIKQLIEKLNLEEAVFWLKDVEGFEKKHGLYQQEEKHVVATSAKPKSQESVGLKKEEYLKDPELTKLIKKVIHETEYIYYHLKKNVGFSRESKSSLEDETKEDALRKEAIKAFKDEENRLKFIKIKYLEDPDIYFPDPGHVKRDIIGRLLQKIVKEETAKEIGRQDLYNRYIKVKKNLSPNLSPNLNH